MFAYSWNKSEKQRRDPNALYWAHEYHQQFYILHENCQNKYRLNTLLHKTLIKLKENKWKSDKMSKNCQKCDFEFEPKIKILLPNAYRSLLRIRFVDVAFRHEEEILLRRRPSMTFFAPPWNNPWANLAEKQLHMCRAISTIYIPRFVSIN